MIKLHKDNLFGIYLFIFLFPFIDLFGKVPGTDVSIHIIVLVMVVSFQLAKINIYILICSMYYLLLIIFSISNLNTMFIIRVIFILLTINAIYLIVKYLLCNNKILLVNIINTTISIYILFGMLQFILPNVIDIFIESRTSNSRGLTSLASEPSSFALFNTLLILSYYKLTNNSTLSIFYVLITLFLSLNSTLLMLLISSFVIYCVVNLFLLNLKRLFYLQLSVIIIYISIYFFPFDIFEQYRIYKVFTNINSIDFFLSDSSINRRLSHIILPLLSILNPSTYFPSYDILTVASKFNYVNSYFNLDFETAIGGNVMSGFGSLISIYGIFGLLINTFLIYISLNNARNIYVSILFILLFISSISISWASFVLLLTLFIFD